MTANNDLKIEFAPGCFDSFEGTQEELDELLEEITKSLSSMTLEELEENSQPLDIDSLTEEELQIIKKNLVALEEQEAGKKRKLN